MNSLQALEGQSGILRLLVYLHQHGEANLSELIKKANINQTGVYNSIRRLSELNLIVEEKEKNFPYRRVLRLTVEGKQIAEHLVKIEKLL